MTTTLTSTVGSCSVCNRPDEYFGRMVETLDQSLRLGYCLSCQRTRLFRAAVGPRPVARSTDPETSHEAAASVRNPALDRSRVYAALGEGPMTDEQILDRCRAHYAPLISPSGARTRRSELVREGLVVDSGDRVRLSSGRRAIVWGRA